MVVAAGELPLFAGKSVPPELGAWVEMSHERSSAPHDAAEQQAFDASGVSAFRVAPLFRLLGDAGSRKIIIGKVRIAAQANAAPQVTLVLDTAWSEAHGWHEDANPQDHADDTLISSLSHPAHHVAGDEHAVVAVLAKAVAESSRNEAAKLRSLRYDLERRLASQLRNRKDDLLRPLLADLIELSIAVQRTRDLAREVIREGLWLWLSDNDAYQRSHTTDQPEPDAPTPVRMHHAAIRHCRELEAVLDEESSRLHSLLDSMSTVAVAQDAEAQQKFNLVAASIAAGLGLPALVLALYSAQPFLPLNSFDRAWRALTPIGITALLAAFVALIRMPGRASPRHYAQALALVFTLIAVLLLAGALVPR